MASIERVWYNLDIIKLRRTAELLLCRFFLRLRVVDVARVV